MRSPPRRVRLVLPPLTGAAGFTTATRHSPGIRGSPCYAVPVPRASRTSNEARNGSAGDLDRGDRARRRGRQGGGRRVAPPSGDGGRASRGLLEERLDVEGGQSQGRAWTRRWSADPRRGTTHA